MRRDEEQRALRRERAAKEGLVAELVSGEPWLGRYRVTGQSGRVHQVKFRAVRGAVHRCDCQDFQTNGLGTCKHIEAVRLHVEATGLRDPAGRAAGQVGTAGPSWEGARWGPETVFFDLETQRLFQEVGGRQRLDKLGLSAAVTFSEADGGFRTFFEEQAQELIGRLVRAQLVVGFNVLRFDYEVLAGYGPEADRLYAVPTLDILYELEQVLPFRPGLDALAAATLGAAKSASGPDAVRWFREGRLEEIARYCQHDVELTRRLFEHGLREGSVSVIDRQGQRLVVEAAWRQGLTAA